MKITAQNMLDLAHRRAGKIQRRRERDQWQEIQDVIHAHARQGEEHVEFAVQHVSTQNLIVFTHQLQERGFTVERTTDQTITVIWTNPT